MIRCRHTRRKAWIGIGSNLSTAAGDAAATVTAAIEALAAELGGGLRVSSLYASAPVGLREQPWFVNAAAEAETTLAPEDLLDVLQRMERRFGRERRIPNGPRTLDLDLLMVEGLVVATERLLLPHPRMAERRFVLTPLAEIAPELMHPLLGRTMAELLRELPDEGEQAVGGVRRISAGERWNG